MVHQIKFYKRKQANLLASKTVGPRDFIAVSGAQIVALSSELQFSYNSRYNSDVLSLRVTLNEALYNGLRSGTIDACIWRELDYSVFEHNYVSNVQVDVIIGRTV